jgi:hypothetical protein
MEGRGYAGGMRKTKAIVWMVGLVWAGIFGCPIRGEDFTLSPVEGDQDLLIIDDALNGENFSNRVRPFIGDFDGDGIEDIADFEPKLFDGLFEKKGLFLFRGPALNKNSRYSQEVDMEIHLPYVFLPFGSEAFFLDMTGDKKDELVIRYSSAVYVFQGRSEIPSSLNLADADLQIVTPNPPVDVAGADLDRDGRGDLIVGYNASSPARTEWHVIQGPLSFPVRTINSSVSAIKKIIGPISDYPGMEAGDLDEDGWEDLVLSQPNLTPPEVDILFGKADFPTTWDLRTTSANVRILVSSYSVTGGGYGYPCKDFNGDHRGELLLVFLSTFTIPAPFGSLHHYDHFLLEGSLLTSGKRISGDPSDPDYVPPHPVLSAMPSRGSSFGDFDRDGRLDLLLGQNLILSSDIAPGPVSAITSPSLHFDTPEGFVPSTFADINKDGFDDLLFNLDLGSTPGIYGGIFIVYGHRLLRNPSIHIRPRAVPSPHVSLALGVEGDPVDMMISGDITDTFREQWIPYATALDVTLSSPEGSKSVKAKFRNAVGRVSSQATDAWTLAAPSPKVAPLTNWVGGQGNVHAEFDCHLPEAGRVRAWVFDPRGFEIKNLFDADHPAGIFTLEWDGTNGNGRKVSPGVYYVVIDSNGRSQHRVIVEP